MGLSLKGIGNAIKKGVKDVGKAIKKNAPFVGAAIGAPGAIVGEVVKHGTDPKKVAAGVKEDLVTGAKNTPVAYGASKMMGGNTVTTGTSGAPTTDGSEPPTGAQGDVGTEDIPSIEESGIDLSKLPKEAVDFLRTNWRALVESGAIVLSGKAAIDAQKRSDALMREGLDMARNDYAERGVYRDAARQNLIDPRTPDLSSVFADPGNPYTKGRQIPVVGNRVPSSYKAPIPQGQSQADHFALGKPDIPIPPVGGHTGTSIEQPPHMAPSGTTTTVNFMGKQYTPDEWAAYQKQNPNWSQPRTQLRSVGKYAP